MQALQFLFRIKAMHRSSTTAAHGDCGNLTNVRKGQKQMNRTAFDAVERAPSAASRADVRAFNIDVRFASESGHPAHELACRLSAISNHRGLIEGFDRTHFGTHVPMEGSPQHPKRSLSPTVSLQEKSSGTCPGRLT